MNALKPNRLVSKNIIITGSASGIGFATASRVISEGANAALFDLNISDLDRAVLSMESAPGQVKAWAVDVAEENDVRTGVSDAVEWFGGRIDVLIH